METQKKKSCAIISYRIMCLKTCYRLKKLSSDPGTHVRGRLFLRFEACGPYVLV